MIHHPSARPKGDDSVITPGVVKAALKKGILIVASAGDDSGGPIEFPSNVDDVLAIGSNEKRKVAGSQALRTR